MDSNNKNNSTKSGGIKWIAIFTLSVLASVFGIVWALGYAQGEPLMALVTLFLTLVLEA